MRKVKKLDFLKLDLFFFVSTPKIIMKVSVNESFQIIPIQQYKTKRNM